MDYDFCAVELNRIDLKDESFRVSTKGLIHVKNELLVDSIKRVGIIHPPHILQTKNKYQVVTGFEKIKVCRQLGWSTMPCLCLESNTPISECVLISIAESVSRQCLNMVEKANVIRMIAAFFPSLEQGLNHIRQVGFDLNVQTAEKLLKVNDFNQYLKLGLIQERIGLPTAFRMIKMTGKSDADCLALSEFMLLMNVSLSRQKELLDYIETISNRDAVSIVDLLTEKNLKLLVDDDKTDGPQKSNRIREFLKRRCYPTLTLFEKHYQKAIKNVPFSKGVSFSPPPQYEGQNYNLRIDFSSSRELRKKVQDIDQLIDSPGFQDLISPRFRVEE